MFPPKKISKIKDFPKDLNNLDAIIYCAYKYAELSNDDLASEAITTFLIENHKKLDKKLLSYIRVKLKHNDDLAKNKNFKKLLKLLE